MTKVKKGDGREEDFNREKIVKSLVKSGVSKRMAIEVADKIPEKEGISTGQIRELVSYELKIRDADAAGRYKKGQYLKEMALLGKKHRDSTETST